MEVEDLKQQVQVSNGRANKIAQGIVDTLSKRVGEDVTVKFEPLPTDGKVENIKDIKILVQTDTPIHCGYRVNVIIETDNEWVIGDKSYARTVPTGKIRVTCVNPHGWRGRPQRWLNRKSDFNFAKRYSEISQFVYECFSHTVQKRTWQHEYNTVLREAEAQCERLYGSKNGKWKGELTNAPYTWKADVAAGNKPCISVTMGRETNKIKVEMLEEFKAAVVINDWENIKL